MALTKIPSSLLDTSSGLDLSGNITLGDNEQILLGDSSDLRLYHDGTNSYIDDNGDGNLTFRSVNQFQFEKFNTELLMELNADGAVNLYYDNSKKFETSSAGAIVTGTLTVTGDLDITGNINSYNVTDLDVTDQTITLGAGQTEANSGGSGIIVDGSGASILWDETTDGWVFNKQIGVNADDCTTASSLSNIVVGEYADASSGIVLRGTTASALNFEDNSSVTAARVYYNHASGYMAFNTEQTERMRIDSVGNLLYNTEGTTGADLSDGGILFRRDSNTYMQIASGTESDTTLLYLYKKSGTGIAQTGSLASRIGDLVIGHSDVGLRFSDGGDSILPAQSGTAGDRDNAIDLGASGARFKDGYFSQNLNISNSSGATLNINTNLGAADSKILLHEGTTASPVNGASIRYDGATNLFKIGVGSNVDTTRLTITRDTGHVGIGTSSPRVELNVQNGSNASSYTGAGPGDIIRASGSGVGNWIASEDDGAMAYFGIDSGQGKFAAYNYATSAEMSMILGQDRMYIKNNGNVGIGTTNPNSALHVVGDTLGGILLKQNSQISYTPADEANFQQGITFENTGSGHAFSVGYGQGGVLKFSYFDNATTYSELGKFNTNGDFYTSGSVILPAGEGISFSATSHTSGMSSEVLDDYEEGTWTASIVSSTAGTVTFNQGYYTKIGNMVFANFQLTVNSQASGDNYVVMSGPFVQHMNNLTWVGYLTNYPYGDRRSGIIVNNSSGNNTQWYLSWSSNSTASTTVRGVIVYQTT